MVSDIDFDLRTLDDSWNHFAVVLTQTSFEFYVNGALVHVFNSNSNLAEILQALMNSAQWRFVLGHGEGYDSSDWSLRWKQSLIDDVRLYSRKLSDLELTTALNGTRPGRRLLAVDYFGPDEEATPESPPAPPTSTRALPVTTTPDPRVVDYYERRVTVTCSCPIGSALCAKCAPLQDERFAVGAVEFYGQRGSAVVVAGYVNYAGVPAVCAAGEEFRTDVLMMSKVCVEKSAVAESSILVIILVVVLVFVLLLIAFAARFRHRIYVLLMPRAADSGVMDWKHAKPQEREPAPAWHPPQAVPAVDLSQQAHVMYKLQFNK